MYVEFAGSGSGTKLLNVIRNKCGNVVPNAAPSTAPPPPLLEEWCPDRDRMGGGWYTDLHFGQKILAVSTPISSRNPTGRTGCPLHWTRGHVPNSFAAYCSNVSYIFERWKKIQILSLWISWQNEMFKTFKRLHLLPYYTLNLTHAW